MTSNPSKTSLLLILASIMFAGLSAVKPAAAAGTQATFVRTDTSTQGGWKGVYGLDGYVIPTADTNQVPGYVVFTPQNQANWIWSGATAPRALQVSSSSSTDVRQATAWYSSGSYDLDVNITDGNTHQFTLYALDWDNQGRAETIQAVDGTTGTVLDARSLSNFSNGIYYIWNVSGHVKFNVTVVSGPNAVVSGAFFDVATANSTPGIAHFVATDTSTQGNWHGIYGTDGYTVVGDSQSTPAYAALTTLSQQIWTWAPSTTDPRALQLGSGSGRIAATWYNVSTFSIDVGITDGNSHEIALYALDWDSKGRAETIQVVDPQTQAVLDSRSIFSFTNGIYMIWNISGHVRFNVTTTSGPNAAISGVFLGGGTTGNSSSTAANVSAPGAVIVAAPISVSLTPSAITLDQNQTQSFAASVQNSTNQSVTWSISPNVGTISSAGVYAAPATITSAQAVTVTATSVATPSGSASAAITLVPPVATAVAHFVAADSSTQGSWIGKYGANGYSLALANQNLPPYAVMTVGASAAWAWSNPTSDVRGLQLPPTGSSRIGATWYGPSTVSLDINLTDGAQHEISVYAIDWSNKGQSQTFRVQDAVTGTILDTEPMTSFAGGTYLSWNVSGHVQIVATLNSGDNAVISGVFFEASGATQTTTAQSQTAPALGYLSVNPSSFNFGSVNISSSVSQTFSISNSGTATVTISNVSISGAGLNATGLSTTVLTPGQSATLSVTYTPAASVGLNGGVTFTSNASNSSVSLALTGTGVQPPPVAHSIELTWGASASAGVVGYNVYRSVVSGGPYTLLTTSPVLTTSYIDSNGTTGQTYYYVVTSVNSSNVQSGYSNVVSATIP